MHNAYYKYFSLLYFQIGSILCCYVRPRNHEIARQCDRFIFPLSLNKFVN